MDSLRKPFFFVGIALIALAFLLEIGSAGFIEAKRINITTASDKDWEEILRANPKLQEAQASITNGPAGLTGQRPPGVGISSLAFMDGLIVFTVGLMAATFFLGDRWVGRLQGIIGLVLAIVVLIGAVVLIFKILAKVILMVSLFVATPFGTMAYLANWGFFNQGGAQTILGFLLLLKLGFVGCLLAAHQRFLQNKTLVFMIIFSLLLNFVVSFLHNLVPRFLVSITDGVAGIVVLVVAGLWWFYRAGYSIIAIAKTIL